MIGGEDKRGKKDGGKRSWMSIWREMRLKKMMI
jgi:hypothetical protein